MPHPSNEQFVRNVFEEARPRFTRLAARFVEDADAIVEQAATIFEEMIPDMAYLEKPDHPMAGAVFACSANLAVYLALRDRGIDAHHFGGAMLSALSKAPIPPASEPHSDQSPAERFAQFVEVADASQTDARPGEFVYEAIIGDRQEFDWGMNITSCAICSAYSKYDAMDLVPYMCATDDVVSDREKQGLRRSGSIAVGASHCDFRYQRSGEPRHLAEQYPELIQILAETAKE
jgi:hypothetical protein